MLGEKYLNFRLIHSQNLKKEERILVHISCTIKNNNNLFVSVIRRVIRMLYYYSFETKEFLMNKVEIYCEIL